MDNLGSVVCQGEDKHSKARNMHESSKRPNHSRVSAERTYVMVPQEAKNSLTSSSLVSNGRPLTKTPRFSEDSAASSAFTFFLAGTAGLSSSALSASSSLSLEDESESEPDSARLRLLSAARRGKTTRGGEQGGNEQKKRSRRRIRE